MLTIGLTGGIGSGKSTVAEFFAELGTPCCDADDVGRRLTQAGSATLLEISALFGSEIVNDDGQLDRPQLRDIIFSDTQKRQQLEAILHPLIRQKIHDWINRQTASYGLISIPLLAENHDQYQFDRVLVLELSPSAQQLRAVQRDKANESDIQAIIASQASAEQRRAIASDIIDNNGNINELRQRVIHLHNKYCALSKAKPGATN